jgi:hypothetical protein
MALPNYGKNRKKERGSRQLLAVPVFTITFEFPDQLKILT